MRDTEPWYDPSRLEEAIERAEHPAECALDQPDSLSFGASCDFSSFAARAATGSAN